VSGEATAPQNLEAEESVLGAILLAGAASAEASAATIANVQVTGLVARDFYRRTHGLVYAAALEVDGRGEPTDVLAVEAELRARRKLTDAGGKPRLHELAALVPATANAAHYARLVVDAAERRGESRAALALARAAETAA
jgi:replicative DNA helicase